MTLRPYLASACAAPRAALVSAVRGYFYGYWFSHGRA